MKTPILSIICLLCFVITSCERYEDIEVDAPYKPKLVASCFLQADNNELRVSVTRSKPYFGEVESPETSQPDYVTNATVELSQGGNRYTLTYDSNENQYVYMMPTSTIGAGQNYSIDVSGDGKHLTGTTQIPGKLNTQIKVLFDSIPFGDGTYQYRVTITCTLLDAGSYHVQLFPMMVYADSMRYPMYLENFGLNRIETLQQGQSLTRTFLSSFSASSIPPVGVEAIVLNADEGYARNEAHIYESMMAGAGSPFVEPAITYSNMKGEEGIGVIGSFTIASQYRINFD
jgi:hypothetical protein